MIHIYSFAIQTIDYQLFGFAFFFLCFSVMIQKCYFNAMSNHYSAVPLNYGGKKWNKNK